MALTYPMHAVPGELLTTTENKEDVAYNGLWQVPSQHDGTHLGYGDLLLVVACWKDHLPVEKTECEYYDLWPALVMHCRSGRIMFFRDIEIVGWVFRPNEEATAWKNE